ncbi:MAG: hypothetical protein JXB43_01135, partial [Dehalococcoidia bacterium]|nr:hypothetical protein [Dehalococcoidia bacterium]
MRNTVLIIAVLIMMLTPVSCSKGGMSNLKSYQIDDDSQGVIEQVNNIYNTCIVSNDPNMYKAEYEAGFIQGKLQEDQIIAARDNGWDSAYLTDPSHSYPKQIPPTNDELALGQKTLKMNWDYTLDYIRKQGDSDIGRNLRRLMYRLIGVYHGASKDSPESLPFDEQWYPVFSDAEMSVGYETSSL